MFFGEHYVQVGINRLGREGAYCTEMFLSQVSLGNFGLNTAIRFL